jgi:TetR/AcrR family transcriptional repressor of nem operon
MQDALAFCLRAAVTAGEIAPSTDCDETAAFILAALQGATLLGKAQRSPRPLERFEDVLFERVLERAAPAR